jgi:hypothetical protein
MALLTVRTWHFDTEQCKMTYTSGACMKNNYLCYRLQLAVLAVFAFIYSDQVAEAVTASTNLVITGPQPNTTVTAGQSLTVSIKGTNGFVPVRALIVTSFLADNIQQAPFSLTFQVPLNLTGQFTISAIAFDAANNIAKAPEISLQVAIPATLTGLVKLEKLYLFSYAPREQLHVTGIYSDGVRRNIRSSALGTKYTSQNPSIATVDSEGMVSGHTAGKTIITVTNKQFSSNVEVEVKN